MAGKYDVAVIGAGPGGYVAAIRASQLGMSVLIIEKEKNLGGTCLNVGCIPSKALLHSTHLYDEASQRFSNHGIHFTGTKLDLKAMMARKSKVVDDTLKGVEFLMKKNKIDKIFGKGKILGRGEIEIDLANGKKKNISCKSIVIATGSTATNLPGVEIDEKKIISSTGALKLRKVPNSMVVIGAGAIGLEIGSIWRRLGSKVTVIEFMDDILFNMDEEVSKAMTTVLETQGFKFELKSKVIGVKKSKSGVTIKIKSRNAGKIKELEADILLVAVGRHAYTDGLGLEDIGLTTNDRGFIKIDHNFKTNVDGIYAIGDVTGGNMLAHKAADEGVVLAEILAGQSGNINYESIPVIVYTWPEVAGIGKTEKHLSVEGVAYNVGRFPFSANPRARTMGDIMGFVKILADAQTDSILGVHIVGPFAGELIQECTLAMEFGGSSEDIARIFHGHPGLSEVVKEAALAVDNRAIHM